MNATVGSRVTFSYEYSDPDGDDLKVDLLSSSEIFTPDLSVAGRITFTWEPEDITEVILE